MKKSLKKGLIISVSTALSLAVVILILALIPVRPLKDLSDSSRIMLVESINTQMAGTDESNQAIKDSIPNVKFSLMTSILTGNLNYGIKNVRTKNDDGDYEDLSISTDTLRQVRAETNGYMLMFVYDEARTYDKFTDNDGNKIIFDRLLLLIPEGNGNIQRVTLYPYLQKNIDNNYGDTTPTEDGLVNSAFYKIYEFTAKMFTSDLYYNISDALNNI